MVIEKLISKTRATYYPSEAAIDHKGVYSRFELYIVKFF